MFFQFAREYQIELKRNSERNFQWNLQFLGKFTKTANEIYERIDKEIFKKIPKSLSNKLLMGIGKPVVYWILKSFA